MRDRPADAPVPDLLPPTIFHQPWWLTAATGGGYAVAVVMQSGRTIGSFPYVLRPLAGRHAVCGMPGLTPFLGPALDDGTGAACNRTLRRAQTTRELLAQAPPCSGFLHRLHRGTTDTLVYQELGYQTAVQFTFEVAAAPPDALWHGLCKRLRAALGQWETCYRLNVIDDSALFTGGRLAVDGCTASDRAVLESLCRAAIGRGQGRIIAAETLAGSIVAAMFVVWDTQAAYCVLTARRRGYGEDVVAFLLWQAIRHSAARGVTFDLDSRSTAAAPDLLAGFGGHVSPRYVVSRFSAGHKLANVLGPVFGRAGADTARRLSMIASR